MKKEPAPGKPKRKNGSDEQNKADVKENIKNVLGIDAVIEFRFLQDIKRNHSFDVAIPEHKIAIEIEGGIWTGGRHVNPKGFINDMFKYNQGTARGWRIIRITPQEVDKNFWLNLIETMIWKA